MRRLGYFLHKTPSGRLLVKMSSPRPPKLGSKVVSSKNEVVGVVVDVIGPVKAPYAIVKPSRQGLELSRYEELLVR